MKRKILNLVQYDYSDIKEFEKHRKIMEKNGWKLTDNTGFEEKGFKRSHMDDESWSYTCCYYKDLL